jgi:hypothetical protein
MRFSAFSKELFFAAMQVRMAFVAEGNEIIFVIRPRVAAEDLVVDFEVGHRSAELTAPAVAP